MSASVKDGTDAKSETSECVNSTIDGIAGSRIKFQERQSAKRFENFFLHITRKETDPSRHTLVLSWNCQNGVHNLESMRDINTIHSPLSDSKALQKKKRIPRGCDGKNCLCY